MAVEDKANEDDKLRRIAELRPTLEKRVNELQAELEHYRTLLDFVNSLLLDKGFKKPEISKPAAIAPPLQQIPGPAPPSTAATLVEPSQAIPIKTATGDLLANLYMDEDTMRVVLAEDKQFTADIPPFTGFLIQRVLGKMQEKDRESASLGEIPPDRILSYEIVKDGDAIRELVIRNTGPDRARELKSTIRWTLEKMHEKMKTTP